MRAIAFDEPPAPRKVNGAIPQELETILLKAMAKDPHLRYETAQEFADDLRRFLEHKPIHAKRPSIVARGRIWARRHRTAVAVTAVLLMVSTIVLAIATYRISGALTKSEKSLATAREAVDGFLVEVGVRAELELRSGLIPAQYELPSESVTKLLERALRLYDELPEASTRNQRSRALFALGRVEQALALEEETGDHLGQAICLLRLGRHEEALAALRNVPSDSKAEHVRADAHYSLGRFEEALAAYDKALARDPTNPSARFWRAETLESLDRNEEALTAINPLAAAFPGNSGVQCSRAHLLLKLGRAEEALAVTGRVRSMDPGSATAAQLQIGALSTLGRAEELIRTFVALEDASSDHPGYAATLIRVSGAFQMLGRFDESLAAVEEGFKALQRLSADAPVSEEERTFMAAGLHRQHASVLNALGRADEALPAAQAACRLDPAFGENHVQRAECLKELGQVDEAIAAFEKAHALGSLNARGSLGLCLARLGRNAEALEALDEALTQPWTTSRWFHALTRGNVLDRLKRHADALTAYEQVLELQPPRRGKKLAYVNQARVLSESGKLAEGLDALDAAVDAGWKDTENIRWAIRSRLFSEDPEVRDSRRALKLARAAVQLEPDNQIHWVFLGAALFRTGKFAESLEALERGRDDGFFLAMAKHQLGHDDARAHYDRAVAESTPTLDVAKICREAAAVLGVEAHGYIVTARAFERLGRYEEAVEALDTAIKLSPDDIDARVYRGAVLSNRLGKHAKALDDFEHVLERDPTHTVARGNRRVVWAKLAWDCVRTDGTRALEYARLGGDEDPRNTYFPVIRAAVYYYGADFTASVVELNKAAELGLKGHVGAKATLLAAMATHKLGQPKAVQVYERAVQLMQQLRVAEGDELHSLRAEAAAVLGLEKDER